MATGAVATLTNLDTGEEYRLPLNPEAIERVTRSVFEQAQVPGVAVPPVEYVRGEGERLPVSFLIDGIQERRDVEGETNLLMSWSQQAVNGAPPPQLLFAWGRLEFPCVAESVRVVTLNFFEDGRPAQSVVEITLLQTDPVDAMRRRVVPVQQAAPQDRAHQVRQGQSLWDIAHQELGDGNRWREIWEANPEIEDPNIVHPGQVVVIPGRLTGNA